MEILNCYELNHMIYQTATSGMLPSYGVVIYITLFLI